MTESVVTELVIDSDTSGADQFSQAMDKASASAQQGVSSAAGMSLAIAGVGVAFVGAITGLRSFFDYVGKQSQSLVDMSTHAELAGISVKEFQQTLFAAMSSGISEKDFVSGLDKIGADLTEASRGATEFGKLFEQNGLSIKNANGELKNTKQAVADLAGLMAQATPAQQQAVARIAGISASWIPFLKQGVDGIEAQKKAALDLGVVIDDSTIAKAKEFNTQWKTAIAGWDLQFKASLASILPLMIQLANIASQVINGIGSFTSDITRLFTPVDQMSMPQLDAQLNSLYKFRDTIEDIQKAGQSQGVSEGILQKALGLPAGSSVNDIDKMIANVVARMDQLQARLKVTPAAGGINLPRTGGDANDVVDRAINTLNRHVEAMKADAAAIGLGDAALAAFRADAAETAAVQANGGKQTDKQVDDFGELKDAAIAAAEALAKAKVASQIDFSNKTKFLSADDVAIATQLKGIYGNDVPAALASTEAAELRVLNAQKMLSDGFQDVGKSMFSAFLSGKNVMDAMVQSLDNLAKKLADKAFENILGSILTGDPVQAAIGAAQAGASALISMFTGDQKAKAALQANQATWAAMTGQVTNFNLAAAGFNLGPLTNEIQSLLSSYTTIQAAALKAKDQTGADAASKTFAEGVNRVVQEFHDGNTALTPLQTSMKALNDEAAGLVATLDDLKDGSLAAQVNIDRQTRMAQLLAQYQDTLTTSLTSRLNTAGGKSYLNDATALLTQHAQDLSDASALGNDPALLAQIAATFHAEAQKIVEDAGLVGGGFSDFINLFPDFAGVVTQSATALAAASDKFAALNKTINDYLDSLKIGNKSILSPQDQLGAAQDQFNRQLGLAGTGDATALGSITQYASALLDQAKSFYASSGGYTDIYRTIESQLSALTGGGPATGFSAPTPVTMPNISMGVVPRISVTAAASNDNGQLFAQQTNSLVAAIGSAAGAQIQKLQEQVDRLVAQNTMLIAAVSANKPLPRRPNERTG